MFLVIFGHQGSGLPDFFMWTSPIKMPLFFAISGYLFTNRGKLDARKLFVRLAVPYFILSLIPIVIIYHLVIGVSVTDELLHFMFGWFIPTFFYSSILFRFQAIKIRSNKMLFCVSLTLAVVGIIIPQCDLLRVFELKTILVTQHFLVIGYIWKAFLVNRRSRLINKWALLFSLVVYLILVAINYKYYPLESIDVHTSAYYNPLLCYIQILCGLYITYAVIRTLCDKYEKSTTLHLLSKIGEYAIVVLLTQTIASAILTHSLGYVLPIDNESYFVTCIYTVLMLIISTFIGVLCDKFCPFVLGVKKKK